MAKFCLRKSRIFKIFTEKFPYWDKLVGATGNLNRNKNKSLRRK